MIIKVKYILIIQFWKLGDVLFICLVVLKNREILFNDCCKETFKEFDTYIWDSKASLKGEDVPVKENDHHMDNLRYFVNTVLDSKNKLKIKNISLRR